MMEAPVPGGAQTFAYRALDRNGADVQGRIEATGDVDALRMLSAQGLTPLEVRAAARWTGGASMPRRRVRLSDCAQLLQELGTLLKGGVALGEALPSLAEAYRGTALEVPLAGMDQAEAVLFEVHPDQVGDRLFILDQQHYPAARHLASSTPRSSPGSIRIL